MSGVIASKAFAAPEKVTMFSSRLLVFPVVVYAQRNMAHMTNNAPEMARLQEKFTEARKRSDLYEMDKVQRKIQALMGGEGGVNPLKSFIPPFLQLPIFMSMFLGLRGILLFSHPCTSS